MVYDWDNKEDVCYRMYIEEKKSLEDIMEYMKEHHQFSPSKRAFQTQFKKWDFPSKQNPAHKNAALVQRIKELWDTNTSQRDMLQTLNDEGHDIKERELMRVRAKNRWLLRVPNTIKTKKQDCDQDVINQLQMALYPSAVMDVEEGGGPMQEASMHSFDASQAQAQAGPVNGSREASPPLSPEVMAKRRDRYLKLEAESAERWATRKRRRRTRGWAGLPADPPGPPRFPSETTIDESKGFLRLDSDMYRELRDSFQRICEGLDIKKKTLAGPERWEAAKDSLIQQSEHLQSMFWSKDEGQASLETKKLALDVICSDVTKRMRTLERRMTIAEAKNALGVNPEESRQLRNGFYQVLKADHFTSKLEAGEEHWKELKQTWISNSDVLQKLLAPGDADPQHGLKVKAMEVLCRDVMKRLRDDQTKRDPTRKKKVEPSPNGPPSDGMGQFNLPSNVPTFQQTSHEVLMQTAAHAQAQAAREAQAQIHAQAHTHPQQPQSHSQPMDHSNMQIDPSLLLAAANDPRLLNSRNMPSYAEQQYVEQQYTAQAAQSASFSSFAIYFRLHPDSEVQSNTRLWVGSLTLVTFEELRQLAVEKFPGYMTALIEGIMKQSNGQEVPLRIETDDELNAYLTSINTVKPIFSVQIVSPWKQSLAREG